MAVSAKVASAYIDLVARTESFEKALGQAQSAVRTFKGQLSSEMHEARGSIALLGEEIGVHVPRHLQAFIAQLPGVSKAMSAAFDSVAVVALVSIIFEAGKKVYEFIEKNEEAAKKNRAAWESISQPLVKMNDDLQLSNDKMANAIAKLEHKPGNGLKEALDEAFQSAVKLGDQLGKDSDKMRELIAQSHVSMWAQLFKGVAPTDAIGEKLQGFRTQLDSTNADYGDTERRAKDAGNVANYNDLRQRHLARLEKIYGEMDSYLETQLRNYQNGAEIDPNGPDRSGAITLLRGAYDLSQGEQQMLGRGYLSEQQKQTVSSLQGAGRGKVVNPLDVMRSGAQAYTQSLSQADNQRQVDSAAAYFQQFEKDSADADKALQDLAIAVGQVNQAYEGDDYQKQIAAAAAAFQQLEDTRPQMSDATRGAVGALNDLTDAFKDTAGQVRDLMIRSINEFNDTLIGLMSGDRRASFSQLGADVARNAAKSLLEQSEGSLMSAFHFGSGGKMGTKGNPMYTRSADGGASGLAGSAGSGLLGMLNDSNFFTKGWMGNFFGAGGIFGGGHALGGDIAAGVPIDVGELGRERFTPMVPGRITPHSDMRGGPLIGYIDARGTDPALTRENFARALAMTHRQAVTDASRIMQDRSRRVPR